MTPTRRPVPGCTTGLRVRRFEDLNANYLRLRRRGITPALCLDHGMTLSYYYRDPDGNHVELQCDCFGDWSAQAWMRTSEAFHANPIGYFVDPERIAAAAGGESSRRSMTRRPPAS